MKQRFSRIKNIFILLVFLSLSFSCRKDYTCDCKAKDPKYNESYTQKMSRAAAEDWCTSIDIDGFIGVNQEPVEGWKCELK